MKKTLLTCGAFMLCALVAPVLSSCGDDDGPDGNGNGNNNSTVRPEIEGTRLTSINGISISYDADGRVSTIGIPPYVTEIDYSNGTLIMPGDEEEGNYSVKFDGKGNITSLSSSWDYTEEEERYKGSGKMIFSYNGDRLVKIQSEYSETETVVETGETFKSSGKGTSSLTWKNGDLTTIVGNYSENESGEKYNWTDTYNIAYGAQKNKYNQMPLSLGDTFADDSEFGLLAAIGFFGMGPANLPTLITETDTEDGETETDTESVSFTLNDNGSISTEKYDGETYYYGYSTATKAPAKVAAKHKKGSVRSLFVKASKRR